MKVIIKCDTGESVGDAIIATKLAEAASRNLPVVMLIIEGHKEPLYVMKYGPQVVTDTGTKIEFELLSEEKRPEAMSIFRK